MVVIDISTSMNLLAVGAHVYDTHLLYTCLQSSAHPWKGRSALRATAPPTVLLLSFNNEAFLIMLKSKCHSWATTVCKKPATQTGRALWAVEVLETVMHADAPIKLLAPPMCSAGYNICFIDQSCGAV